MANQFCECLRVFLRIFEKGTREGVVLFEKRVSGFDTF